MAVVRAGMSQVNIFTAGRGVPTRFRLATKMPLYTSEGTVVGRRNLWQGRIRAGMVPEPGLEPLRIVIDCGDGIYVDDRGNLNGFY